MSSFSIIEGLERQKALETKGFGENAAKIHVDEIASKVAAFYERARNLIDYREEHLLHKAFITRALRRRLALQASKDIAEPLVKDVIRAGHLPNDTVPEAKIPEVARVIATFRAVRDGLRGERGGDRRALTEWFFGVTVNAIEEILFPPMYQRTMSDFMTATIRGNLAMRSATMSDTRLSTGVFVGVERALLRADREQLRAHLFNFLYPNYAQLEPAAAPALAAALPDMEKAIERALNDPKRAFFLALANRWAPAFSVLADVVRGADKQDELVHVLGDKPALEERAHEAYRRRYRREKSKLNRFAFFTVLSFFISKVAVALAIEIPLQDYFLHGFSLPNTIANIVFAPLLMLVIVAFIRMPSRKNEGLVVAEIDRLVFAEHPREYSLVLPKKRGFVAEGAVRLFYVAMFFVSIFIIARLLTLIDFNIADIIVFVLFTSLVGAAGVKVHNRAREISLERRNPKVLSFLLDVFAIPFITIGTWIISGLSSFNVIVIAVDLLVDMPFQIFVEFLENLNDFIRGRKEAID